MHTRSSAVAIGLLTLTLAACSAATTTTTKDSHDFEQTGLLIRNAPGLTPGVWYLQYEEANNPSLTMRLSFDDESICSDIEKKGPCERSIFKNNLPVTIRGMRENDGILVKEMDVE